MFYPNQNEKTRLHLLNVYSKFKKKEFTGECIYCEFKVENHEAVCTNTKLKTNGETL